jgi:hypothetical protein
MVTQYSQGLKSVREGWEVPPGMDRSFVVDKISTPEKILEEYIPKMDITHKTVDVIAKEDIKELDENLFKTELQSVRNFDPEKIVQEVGNPDIKKHLKGILDSMSGGDFKAAVSGGFIRFNYKIPEGDTIDMVYDMRPLSGGNNDGLILRSYLQTNSNSEVLNLGKLVPEATIKFRSFDWYMYLLRPSLYFTAMGAHKNDISIFQGYFKFQNYQTILPPAIALTHESGHLWFAKKYPELSNQSVEHLLSQVGLMGVDIISMLLAMGINPWYLLPSVVLNLGTYSMSRDITTSVGKRAHANLANESHSDYIEYVLGDYLTRKGFKVGKNLGDFDKLTVNFVKNYMMAYQPLSWGLIDSVRYANQDPKKNENLPQSLAI